MAKFVVITNVSEDKTASDGRTYRTVQVAEQRFVPLMVKGAIVFEELPPITNGFNVWETNNLTNEPDFLWGREEGARVPGSIIKKATQTYLIPDSDGQPKEVNSYSMFVMGNTDDIDGYGAEVATAFKRLEKNKVTPIFLLGAVDHTVAATVSADDLISEND